MPGDLPLAYCEQGRGGQEYFLDGTSIRATGQRTRLTSIVPHGGKERMNDMSDWGT
jgi:hypothetical protein